jgi:hypothetical protein
VESVFCRALVAAGYLSEQQMQHAAHRYRLGATAKGGVIFWQIGADDDLCDGKVMYYQTDCHRDHQHHPTWVSTLLTRRYQWADSQRMTSRHCLFGLHLLAAARAATIAVVEAEKTAVILSELFPDQLWLATGGLGNVQTDKFRPLRRHKVVLFPDTDPEGKAFQAWWEAARTVMQQPFWEGSPPIRVSSLLELHASADQKRRKIDLVDFLYESSSSMHGMQHRSVFPTESQCDTP